MKTILVFAICIASAAAATLPFNVPEQYRTNDQVGAQILQSQNDNTGVGPYNFG